MKKPNHARASGFTLVELLVVIVIIITLAGLAYMMAGRVIRSARAAKDVGNLRQCGQSLVVYATDLGYFPMGYNWSNGMSWADLVVRAQVGEDSMTTQAEMLWSPLLAQNVPPTLKQGAVTHFGVNPYIMSDSGATDPKTGVASPKWIIRPLQLTRPAEQFLLCSVPPQSSTIPYKLGHPVVWGLRNMAGGGYPADGSIPQSLESNANRALGLASDLAKKETSGTLPDFYRYHSGKGQFMFVDGHVESLAPTQVKQKHLAVSY
jgi:prepilin-type N-terminal cleavage/methylation domain-containing protein/prepilin-type processing-associated H-X9-DG protein